MPCELPEVYWENVLSGLTLSISSGSNPDYLNDQRTAKQWTATSSIAQSIIADLTTVTDIDSFIVDTHNLSGRELNLVGSNSLFSISTTIQSWTPSDNENQLRRFTEVSYRYLKFSIGAGSSAASIGELFAGIRLQFPLNPSIPYDDDGQIDQTEVDITTRRRVFVRQRDTIKKIFIRFSIMTMAQFETFKTLWKNTRSHKAWWYCFNPDTEPEKVFLGVNKKQHFTAKLINNLRRGYEIIFQQVR